jgi:hypothetical protein
VNLLLKIRCSWLVHPGHCLIEHGYMGYDPDWVKVNIGCVEDALVFYSFVDLIDIDLHCHPAYDRTYPRGICQRDVICLLTEIGLDDHNPYDDLTSENKWTSVGTFQVSH